MIMTPGFVGATATVAFLAIFHQTPLSAQARLSADSTGMIALGIGGSLSFRKGTLAGDAGTSAGRAIDLEAVLRAPPAGRWRAESRTIWRTRRELSTSTGKTLEVERLTMDALVGIRLVRLRLGFSRRSIAASFEDEGSQQWSLGLVGAELVLPLGVPTVSVTVSAARYFGVTADDFETGGRGREGEVRFVWLFPRTYVFGGYRYDEFSPDVPAELGGSFTERTANLFVGVGFPWVWGGPGS